MNREEMKLLSDTFRSYVGTLSAFARDNLERTIQTTFGIKNLRNVQLWTRPGAVQRDIVNPRIGTIDYDMRVAFVTGLLEQRVPTFPVKTTEFDDLAGKNGLKLREYLLNEYTRKALSRILINPDGTIGFEYDVYGNGYDDDQVNEDDLEEFLEE